MNNPFTTPAELSSDFFKVADNEGALLIIRPTRFEPGVSTANGAADVLYCDIWAVDGNHAGENWSSAWITQSVLTKQLRPREGQLVLGRIAKGTAQPGKSAPWVLNPPTDEDMKAGAEAWTKVQTGQFATPAAETNNTQFNDTPPF